MVDMSKQPDLAEKFEEAPILRPEGLPELEPGCAVAEERGPDGAVERERVTRDPAGFVRGDGRQLCPLQTPSG